MLAIRRILYPTDFSDLSRPAFDLACSLARDYGAEIVVLHVRVPPVAAVVDGMAVPMPTVTPDETLARLRRVTADDPSVRVVHRLEEGDPGSTILRVAAELEPDLLVMGTHGRSGLGRLLVGSVAEKVMRKAPCPVLTVKAPAPALTDSPVGEQAVGV